MSLKTHKNKSFIFNCYLAQKEVCPQFVSGNKGSISGETFVQGEYKVEQGVLFFQRADAILVIKKTHWLGGYAHGYKFWSGLFLFEDVDMDDILSFSREIKFYQKL